MHQDRLYGIWKLVDVPGWQKWFGAAVLGFTFALFKNYDFSLSQLQGVLIGISLILCYNQSINDCFDVEIDKLKEERMGKKLIVSGVISRKTALAITFLLLVIGLASAWFATLDLFFIAAFMAFLGTVYSAPPLRLKMKYPFSTLTQLIGCFLPFLAGVAVLFPIDWKSIIISSAFCFLAMVHRFTHEIYYSEIDSMTSKITVAVKKGVKTTKMLRTTFLFIGTVEFLFFSILGWVSLGSLLLFLLYLSLCVETLWMSYLPKPLNKLVTQIIPVSGLVLLPIGIYMSANM